MRRLYSTVVMALALLGLAACGKSDETPLTRSLTAPANVAVRALEETSATLQWNPVEGAQSYEWELSKGGSVTKSGSVSQRNVTVNGLEAGTTYEFSVRAAAGEVKSAWSKKEFTTKGTAPEPPGPDDQLQCIDAPLVWAVGSKSPQLGTSGCITVYKGSQVVDKIDLAHLAGVTVREDGQMVPSAQITAASTFNTFMDAVPSGGRYRLVHYTPLRFDGSSLVIKLHSGVLDFGTQYKVTIDAGVVQGEAATEWSFATKARPSGNVLGVSADGKADFCTLQGALSYAGSLSGAVTVNLAAGIYREMLYLRDKADVSVIGTSRAQCVIEYANAEALCSGSGAATSSKPSVGASVGTPGGRGVFLVENCNNLRLEKLTIRNSYGAQGQAECIYFNSGSNAHRLVIEDCELHSLQDTFLTKGEVWVHNSLIAGNVDFIWGYPKACLFEDCEIRCLYHKNGGYVVQARVPAAANKGFVFLNCKITAGEGTVDGSVYLARSAGQSDCFDNVTYVNCSMASVIASSGWYTSPAPNPSTPSAASGWKEYGTTGVSTASRNAYGKQLSATEAQAYSSKTAVLGW